MNASPDTRLFGAVERRLFRSTAVLFTLVALVLLIAAVTWILGQALSYFYNLVLPLSVAGIMALMLYPVVDYLERRLRLSRVLAVSLIVLLFVLMISGAMFLLLPIIVRQVGLFTELAPGIIAGWQDALSARFPGVHRAIMESAEDGAFKDLAPGVEESGKTITSYAGMLIGLGFVPLLLFFALLSGDRLRGHVESVLSVFGTAAQSNIMYCLDVFIRQVTGFFQGQFLIALLMGFMFATGFTLVGLKGGILIGLSLGIINIVPMLGTLIGLIIVLPIAYFQPEGSLQLLGLCLLVFSVVQLIESWVLTPKIMANRSGLHPAVVLISVFFWGIALGGIIGMILAVPLTALLIAIWAQAKDSLTRSMQSEHEKARIETSVIVGDHDRDEPLPADRPVGRTNEW